MCDVSYEARQTHLDSTSSPHIGMTILDLMFFFKAITGIVSISQRVVDVHMKNSL
jgi:hypothetical protein